MSTGRFFNLAQARARHCPGDAVAQSFPEARAVAYRFVVRGLPAYALFRERAAKPCVCRSFRSETLRDAHLQAGIAALCAQEQRKRDRRLAAASFRTALRRDDVLVAVWGYDQTNVDFFQVVALRTPKLIEVRKLVRCDASDGPMAMTGTCLPVVGEFVGELKRAHVRPGLATGEEWVDIGERRMARRWNGAPQRFSNYG